MPAHPCCSSIISTSSPSPSLDPQITYSSWVVLPPTPEDDRIYIEPGEVWDDWPVIGVTHHYTTSLNWITSTGLLSLLSRGWDPAMLFDTIPCKDMHDEYRICSVFCKNTVHKNRVLDHRTRPQTVKHPLNSTLDDGTVLRITLAHDDVPLFRGNNSIRGNDEGIKLHKPLWKCFRCAFVYSRKCYGAWLVYGCCKLPHPLCVDCFMDTYFPSETMWRQKHPSPGGSPIPPPPPPIPWCTNGCAYTEICLYPIRQLVDRPAKQFSLLRESISFKTNACEDGIYCAGITLCANPRVTIDQQFEMSMIDNSHTLGQYDKVLKNPGHPYLQALRMYVSQRYGELNVNLKPGSNTFGLGYDADEIEDKKDELYAAWAARD
jgi:hypothetical protein